MAESPHTKKTIVRKRQRIAIVLEMLVACTPVGAIQTKLSKRWGCRSRTIRTYITECRTKILPTWYEWSDQRVVATEMIARLDRIASKAVKARDYQAAVRALRQQAELYGLNSARMIAQERDSLAMQIEQLRKSQGEGAPAGGNAPMDQANAVRQVYGQRRFENAEEYAAWVAKLAPQTGGNGVN